MHFVRRAGAGYNAAMVSQTGLPFALEVDNKKRLVSFTPRGVWKLSDAQAMLAEFDRATKALGAGDWFLLLDGRQWAAQSAEVQDCIVRCMQQNKRNGLKRAARVIDASVVKLQLDRLAQQSTHDRQDFTDIRTALQWLLQA